MYFVFVQSYSKQHAFIAAEAPSADKVELVLEVIAQKQCRTIVVLCTEEEMKEVSSEFSWVAGMLQSIESFYACIDSECSCHNLAPTEVYSTFYINQYNIIIDIISFLHKFLPHTLVCCLCWNSIDSLSVELMIPPTLKWLAVLLCVWGDVSPTNKWCLTNLINCCLLQRIRNLSWLLWVELCPVGSWWSYNGATSWLSIYFVWIDLLRISPSATHYQLSSGMIAQYLLQPLKNSYEK